MGPASARREDRKLIAINPARIESKIIQRRTRASTSTSLREIRALWIDHNSLIIGQKIVGVTTQITTKIITGTSSHTRSPLFHPLIKAPTITISIKTLSG